MNKLILFLRMLVLVFGISACTTSQQLPTQSTVMPSLAAPTEIAARLRSCRPTLDDSVSPSYRPNTPERTVVGKGHVVTGVVLSSADCQPLAQARLEFWPEVAGLGHPDSERATFFTDQEGRYRFECDLPEHIHMRISAPGYRTIGVNSYHPEGQAEGTFDIVLAPEK